MAGGAVGAEAVVAERGGTRAVGAQRQHMPNRTAGLPDRGRRVDAGRGEDQPVHAAAHERLDGDAFGVPLVVGGGDHREQAAAGGRRGYLLVEHGHDRVGQLRDDTPTVLVPTRRRPEASGSRT